MAKWCFNYESGEYVYNWDDSEYRHDEEEEECYYSLFNDEDDD